MKNLLEELEGIPRDDNFRYSLGDLTERWRSKNVGLDGVEAILAFIEKNPTLDYGCPGELTHFAEEFYRKGYEAALLRSFGRHPTPLTAWMLNRVINGTRDSDECEIYVTAFEKAEADPATDPQTRSEITHYLDRTS